MWMLFFISWFTFFTYFLWAISQSIWELKAKDLGKAPSYQKRIVNLHLYLYYFTRWDRLLSLPFSPLMQIFQGLMDRMWTSHGTTVCFKLTWAWRVCPWCHSLPWTWHRSSPLAPSCWGSGPAASGGLRCVETWSGAPDPPSPPGGEWGEVRM